MRIYMKKQGTGEYRYQVAAALDADEGQSVTFTVNTQNVPDGTILTYNISGVDPADIIGDMSGTLVVTSNIATTTVSLAADDLVEGPESLTFTVTGRGLTSTHLIQSSATITINDVPTYVLGSGIERANVTQSDFNIDTSTAGVGTYIIENDGVIYSTASTTPALNITLPAGSTLVIINNGDIRGAGGRGGNGGNASKNLALGTPPAQDGGTAIKCNVPVIIQNSGTIWGGGGGGGGGIATNSAQTIADGGGGGGGAGWFPGGGGTGGSWRTPKAQDGQSGTHTAGGVGGKSQRSSSYNDGANGGGPGSSGGSRSNYVVSVGGAGGKSIETNGAGVTIESNTGTIYGSQN